MRKAFILILSLFVPVLAMAQVSTWSNTGPVQFPVNVSGQVDGMGRVCQIKFSQTNPGKMYAITSSGGLFISTDTARTWTVTHGTDELPNTQTSCVCVDYTNDSIIYISTGDPDYYYDDYGIWKSTDGGYTFNPANTGIGDLLAVEILMSPVNHNVLVAATDNGVWKSTDGATTWTQTLSGGSCKSMKMKPGSDNTLYMATDTLFYLSHDMGSSWTNITAGLEVPAGNDGMRVAVSAADTNVVYLGTTDGYGVIMKSDDGGNTFSVVYSSDSQCIVCYDSTVASGSQGNYNFTLTANPTNANELLLGSQCVWRSTDGGVTWSWRTQWYDQVHTDMHDIEFDPWDVNLRFNGNDGGVWLSTDTLATSWTPMSTGMASTEMYHAAQSPVSRQLISIGAQDNGEMYYDGIWKCNRGGDWGPRCAIDYLDNGTVYYDNGNRRNLSPLGGDYSYNAPFSSTPSFAIEFTPFMTHTAFIGTDSLWVTEDVQDATPVWTYLHSLGENILSIASDRADTSYLYYVTDNSHLVRIHNTGGWGVTAAVLNTPAPTDVAASIATDKYNPNVLFLSCNDSVYWSTNKGNSWTNISYNLPGLNVLKVIADEYSPLQRLFVSEGNYVYYKDSTTSTWTLSTGLPTIMQVTDFMVFNDSTSGSLLRLSSYGRGVWENSINSHYPPDASYAANKTFICPGDTVQFNASIYGSYTSVSWSFPGGTPSSSTSLTPGVIYSAPGTYNAMLVAYGPYGNDTVIKVAYITVTNGITSLLTEGFEETTFPPAEWIMASESGVNWVQDTSGGYGLSAHSIEFDNFDNSTSGAHDRIITPEINISAFDTGAYLTFDVAYSWYGSGYDDTLQVELSTDCGKTFVPVYVKDSTVLATAPSVTANIFVPTAGQWRTDTISLSGYAGGVTIAFDNVGHYGQAMYIDNVNMHGKPLGLNNIALQNTLNIYPNPTEDYFVLRASGITGASLNVACYNMPGSMMWNRDIEVSAGNVMDQFSMAAMAPGIYLLKVTTPDGASVFRKIVRQ